MLRNYRAAHLLRHRLHICMLLCSEVRLHRVELPHDLSERVYRCLELQQ